MSDKKNTYKYLAYGLLLILLFFLLKNLDIEEITSALKRIPLNLLLFLLFLQVITQCLLSLQWYFIARNYCENCSFQQIFYILCTGSMIEALTPGAKIGGEVTRLYYLKKECHCTTETASHIIIIQKSISMTVLFAVCMSSFFYISKHFQHFMPTEGKVFVFLLGTSTLLLFISFLFFSAQLARFFQKINHKYARSLHQLTTSYHYTISRLGAKQWLTQFSISLLVWLLFPLKMMILVGEMGIFVDGGLLLSITMTAYMLALLPLTPGGLGTFEGAVVGLFSFLNVETEVALTIAVIFRFVTFWFVMIISSIYVIFYRKRRHNEEIS